MAVKALVNLFETRSTGTPSRESPKRTDPEHNVAQSSPSGGEEEAYTPAKLTPHPLLRRREPSHTDENDDDLVRPDSLYSSGAYSNTAGTSRGGGHAQEGSADVTDELLSATGRSSGPRTIVETTVPTKQEKNLKHDTPEIELEVLYRQDTAMSSMSGLTLTVHAPASSSARPLTAKRFSSTTVYNKHADSSATLVPLLQGSDTHSPIPLSTIFARKAAPLYLPRLDDYIASLPAISLPLPPVRENGKGKGKAVNASATLFPPMERLAATGKTLADLEHNSTITPSRRNRNSIFSGLTSIALGITGSSALASFYSVQGLFDTVQIFALILSTIVSHSGTAEGRWRTLFLVKIPNILALSFASTLTQSLVLLVIFMTIAGLLLYYFYRVTCLCCSLSVPEGQQRIEYPNNSWLVVLVSFVLTVIYLPLSTLAVHVLIWSDDLWVVPNPYINATTNPPSLPPLGPANEYRAPLDFCYTTTMQINEVNYAPVIVILAIISFFGLTVWFPIHLYRTIQKVVPIVDPYTELGVARSRSDMDREYQRLLDRDHNPLSFLYNGFRRGWGSYESIFLLAKLTALLITSVVDPDNCLFRSLSRYWVQIARQIVLLVSMLVYFILQCIYAPFLNPVNNASEWTSRMNYVLTSAVALAVAFNISNKNILDGAVLYAIYIVTYGLSVYFTIINLDVMRRLVKRLARRIDFSIDMLSPRVDLSPSSPHTRRRIWQEAITTLFLTSPECEIPKSQSMEFQQARDSEYPPYLLDFSGSPSERLVENLKILRDVGSTSYYKALALTVGPDHARFRYVADVIQNHFVGPDCYWKPPAGTIPKCSHFFGNAWWIPFPPTLVIRYDEGPLKVLQELSELELYIWQNSSQDVQRRRQVRLALRALDGLVVIWPYDYTNDVGSRHKWCCCGRRYGARTVTHYETCILSIKRHGQLLWEGVNLGSGFDVELTYTKDVKADGALIGLTDDFDLTQPLARFLAMNELLITDRLASVEANLRSYRQHNRRECQWKLDTLTYQFLTAVYNQPREFTHVADTVLELERDARVRDLVVSNEAAVSITYERFLAVSTSELAAWWYIFWDDLWRRNYDTISALQKHASDFNPHYPTSIAYKPLPRPALEAFLTQRGLLHKVPKWGDFFNAGFLNKMYLRMNDIVFHGSYNANIFHLGDDASELDMEEIDVQTLMQPSTLGTGAGTDYDDVSIRARPVYRWEGILEDPLRRQKAKRRPFLAKLAVWFGVSPFWRSGLPSQGLALDVQLVNGRYILFGDTNTQTDTLKDNLRTEPK